MATRDSRGTSLAEAREFALSLPETTEEPHHDFSSFRVKGKIFATVPPAETHLHVFVDDDLREQMVATDPAAFEKLWWGEKVVGLRIKLAAASKARVTALLEAAWTRKAPKRLAAEWKETQP
jgi:hypothetical protein